MKICSLCKSEGPFYTPKMSYCIECQKKYARQKQSLKRERARLDGLCKDCLQPREPELKWRCRKCTDNINIQKVKNHADNRRLVLEHYGNKCSCCGETIDKFLGMDHINNDGHTQKHKEGKAICNYIVANNFPSTFRILCHNCNLGRYLNGGECPHKCLKS